MSTKRFQFDPAAAMTAATAAAEAELNAQLDEVDADARRLCGELINLAREVFEGLQADDDQPVKVQLTNARAARDKLQAMLDGAKGASSRGLSDQQKTLIELLDAGDIRLVEVDDPDNPGTKVPAVRENRGRLRQRGNQTSAQPPAQGSNAAPTQSTPAQPAAPAPVSDPNSSSTGTSGSAPAAPATPAQSNTGQPSDPPAQAGSGTTPAPTAQFEPGIIDKAKAGLAGLFRREPTS